MFVMVEVHIGDGWRNSTLVTCLAWAVTCAYGYLDRFAGRLRIFAPLSLAFLVSSQRRAKLEYFPGQMITSQLNPEALEDVPVFPLPQAVLLPGAELPLHIFEPRYREMTARCLRQARPLLVVAQLRPGFEADYGGRPPMFDVAGLGEITQAQRHADGTYDLRVRGLARVHVTELPADDLSYRRGRLRPLRERPSPTGDDRDDLPALLSLVTQVAALLKRAEPSFELGLPPLEDPARVVDSIAEQLLIDPAARQEALELLDVGQRLRFVMKRLSRLHVALSSETPPALLN